MSKQSKQYLNNVSKQYHNSEDPGYKNLKYLITGIHHKLFKNNLIRDRKGFNISIESS